MLANTRFIMSAAHYGQLPTLGLKEIAFVGRSNVGKSSLLGAILGKRDLVKTSRTPGQTRLLNLFGYQERLALVDLPGYGYAKISEAARRELSVLVHDYLLYRRELTVVVQVLDARRWPVNPLDYEMRQFLQKHGQACLWVVNKIDLIPTAKQAGLLRQLATSLEVPLTDLYPCAAKQGKGIEALRKRLFQGAKIS